MSAGIEPLKTSIRIWWRDASGERDRETLYDTPPTDANLKKATAIAQSIDTQIEMGTFDRDQTFPHSPKRKTSYFGHYINQWRTTEKSLVSESSWTTYLSKVNNHISAHWAHKQIAKITVEDVENWVYKDLIQQKQLSSNTIKEILGLWRKIYSYWSRHQSTANDPSQYIKLNYNDPEDIRPFSKSEISLIIQNEDDQARKNLWTVMIWSGLSSHELLALAVSDLDLESGHAYIRRGVVKGVYRVTKNRRRKRQVELLPIVVEALRSQIDLIKDTALQTVMITERDHRTERPHSLQFLWHNPNTGTHHTYEQLRHQWADYLERINVDYRPLNNGRHTYASQVLSTGVVTAEWLAKQLGHSNTDMIHKHYGKFIPQDSGHIIKILDHALQI